MSTTVTITPQASNGLLNDGTYVYHFSGEGQNVGAVFAAGAFTVKGGVITGGEQDLADGGGEFNDSLVASSCSLSKAGNNIQIVLATAETGLNVGVNGVITLRGTVVSGSRVLVSEFDSFAAASGSIDLQTSAAAPSGGYAFAVSGWTSDYPSQQLGIGGVLNLSGSSLVTAGSVFDYSEIGGVLQGQTFDSGTVSSVDQYGRVTFSLTPSSSSRIKPFSLVGYVVGSSQIQLVEGNDMLSGDMGGMALAQGANTGKFSQMGVANATYVFAGTGQNAGGNYVIGGDFVFNPNGTLGGLLALSDSQFHGTNTISSGSYTVDPTGRVTLSGIDVGYGFQLYLDGNGNALELGDDKSQVTTGPAYQQSAPLTSFNGNYALVGQGQLNAQSQQPWSAVGLVTVSSNAFSGSTDYNVEETQYLPSPTVTSTQSLSGTENSSTNSLSLAGLYSRSFSNPSNFAYFPIDSRRAFAIETDGSQLGLLLLEATNP